MNNELKTMLINFAHDIIDNQQPEDDDSWFGFNDEIDVNIWLDDETNTWKASAYDVINGNIKTETWTELI
jgi:hypothetical protein